MPTFPIVHEFSCLIAVNSIVVNAAENCPLGADGFSRQLQKFTLNFFNPVIIQPRHWAFTFNIKE
jgi:hypothetical protein